MIFKSLARALSPVAIINGMAHVERVRLIPAVSFAGDRQLDLYLPRRLDGPPPPAVIFYYGGGWDSGQRQMYRFVGAALAAKGLIAVIPDYRVYPEVGFPEFLRDAARAVRWAHDELGKFGGDPRRMVVVGHSAGAHIAAMLAFDRQWLGEVGLDPDADLRGVVGLSGPYDFLPLYSPTLKIIFGPEAGLAATQPINFVDRPVLPTFLGMGTSDRVVDPANSIQLAARIRSRGGDVRLKPYPRIGHELVIGAFGLPLRPLLPVLRDTVSFVKEVAGEPVTSPRLAGITEEQMA